MNTAATERLDQTAWFLWMRIVGGAIAAITAGLQAWTNFQDFPRWCSSLSIACFFAFFRVRQHGESRRMYLTSLRGIITALSALATVITNGFLLLRFAR